MASCNSPFLPCQCCGSSGPTWESCMAALQCRACRGHCPCHDVVSMAVAARCVLYSRHRTTVFSRWLHGCGRNGHSHEGRLRGLPHFALSAVSVLWQQWPNMGIVHGSFAVPFLLWPLLMSRCGEYGRRCTLCAVLTPLYHSRITLASWLWPQRP